MNWLNTFFTGLLGLLFAKKSSRVGGPGGTTGLGLDQSSNPNYDYDYFANNGKFDISGWIDKAMSSSGSSSSIIGGLDGLLSALINRVTAEHMTGADKEAAMVNYGMQSQFFQDYQSPQAQVQQYLDAGLNPALTYQHGVSIPGAIGGNASASAASIDPGQLLTAIAGLKFKAQEVSADTYLKRANASLMESQARMQNLENSVWAERYEFWKREKNSTVANTDADTFLKKAQPELIRANINESQARTTLLGYQSLIEKQNADDQKRMNQILYEVRVSARDMNKAKADYDKSQTDLNKRKLYEAEQSWGTRWRTLQEELKSLEQGNEAFWTDKRINELVQLSEMYDNYKESFKVGPFSGQGPSFYYKIDKSLPSLYGEHL